MYIHTRFNIPRSFSPQFYKVVIYMDHDKKVMVLVNTVVRVYTWEEATQRGETGEAQVSDMKEKVWWGGKGQRVAVDEA